jgi:hypothetical protein
MIASAIWLLATRSMLISHLTDLTHLPIRNLLRLPHHDIHSDRFLISLQVDLLDDFETHLAVDDRIDVV